MRWWGVWPPSKFFEASEEDQVFAFAAYEADMMIQAWDSHVANKENEQKTANLSKAHDD